MMTLLLGGLLTAAAQDLGATELSGDDTLTLAAPDAGPTAVGIINGAEASTEEYPMTGGMLMSASFFGFPMDTFVCSSTLIAPDVVLIAAHCLDDYAFTLGFGELEDKRVWWSREADLTGWDGTTQDPELPADAVEAVSWVIHPDFSMTDFGVGITQNDDIALMFLSEAVTDVPHAYLPTADEATQLAEGALVAVVGWGQQVATSGGWGDAPEPGTYAIKMWGESTLGEVGSHEFHVGPETEDVRKCHGDSGGPTFMDVETTSTESMRLIGVTSHAYDAQTDCNVTGGVDTRADAYLEWIDAEMNAACEDGTRAWCDETGIIAPPEPVVADDDDADGVDGEDGKDGKAGCSAVGGASGATIAVLSLLGVAARRRR